MYAWQGAALLMQQQSTLLLLEITFEQAHRDLIHTPYRQFSLLALDLALIVGALGIRSSSALQPTDQLNSTRLTNFRALTIEPANLMSLLTVRSLSVSLSVYVYVYVYELCVCVCCQ